MSGIHQMLMASATAAAQARNASISVSVGSGGAGAEYMMTSGGSTLGFENGWQTNLGDWLLAGSADSFEVRATVVGGSTPQGVAVGSWLNLGTTISWFVNADSNGFYYQEVNTDLTIEIRFVGGSSTISSASVYLFAASGTPP
jgi:hypothetical protein